MSPQSTVPVEPLSAEEETTLRATVAGYMEFPLAVRSWVPQVARLLATLDAARASQPITATAGVCGCTADTELGAGPGCTVCGHRDHGRSGCLAALAVREDEPTKTPRADG